MKKNTYIEGSNAEIDTCYAPDTGKYETAVSHRGEPWIIVQQYETIEEAVTGHDLIVEQIKKGKTFTGEDDVFKNSSFSECYERWMKTLLTIEENL